MGFSAAQVSYRVSYMGIALNGRKTGPHITVQFVIFVKSLFGTVSQRPNPTSSLPPQEGEAPQKSIVPTYACVCVYVYIYMYDPYTLARTHA